MAEEAETARRLINVNCVIPTNDKLLKYARCKQIKARRRDAHPGGVEKLRRSRTTVAKETHNGGVINIRSTIDRELASSWSSRFFFYSGYTLVCFLFLDRARGSTLHRVRKFLLSDEIYFSTSGGVLQFITIHARLS